MLPLELSSHSKRSLSVTGVNPAVYPTNFCFPFLYREGIVCTEDVGGGHGSVWGMYRTCVGYAEHI